MTEHLTGSIIERYRRRQIDPAERKLAETHLAVCEACVMRVLDSEESVLAFNSLSEAFLPAANEEPFHLSHAELKRFAANAASGADKIICESHLEDCSECNEELRLLSAAAPGDRAAKAKVAHLTPRAPSPEKQAWRWLTAARVAAVVALVGLLLLAVALWRQSSSRQESVRNEPVPAPTPIASPAPSNSPAVESVTPNSTAIVLLKDNGKEIQLDQDGKLIGLEELDETTQQMAKAALAGENLAKPRVLEGLSSPRIKLLGEPGSDNTFRLISPLGQVITEDRPTLKWRPLIGATTYVVTVFDGTFNRIAQSPPLSKTEWTLTVPLSRGGNFLWEVTANADGKAITAPAAPAPKAQFRVLEADKLSALKKLKASQPTSHLALGLTYAKFGLLNEAQAEFRQLARENPQSAEAKKLLRTVQQWR